MSSLSPLHQLATQHFDEHYKPKQSQSFLSLPEYTIWIWRYRTLRKQIFIFGWFSLKAVYNSCKLQRLLQVAKFFFIYSFTHTNIVFLFKHLPPEIVIFINVCYRWSVSVVKVFPFIGSRFSWYSTCFFYFVWSSNKVIKDIKIL